MHTYIHKYIHFFSTIGEEELYKLVKSAKPTTCMLDPIPSKLLVLPEVIDPLLSIINSSLSLGYVPKNFKLAVIKPLIKKPHVKEFIPFTLFNLALWFKLYFSFRESYDLILIWSIDINQNVQLIPYLTIVQRVVRFQYIWEILFILVATI